ncbi:MAG: glucose-1-phosphate adenylyltransferase [Planctomycetaceae bacterium]
MGTWFAEVRRRRHRIEFRQRSRQFGVRLRQASTIEETFPLMNDVITLVLAGGIGRRLFPLTSDRAKPAVPFGGQYRIIDFALSNCLHSGLRRVLVLPQYKSHSLMKHLRDGWSVFNPSLGEYITPVPPQMRTNDSWYQGTADAIYQNLYLLERSGAKSVVVLSGDHIYRMDYAEMLHCHRFSEADATVACMPVDLKQASGFGIVSVNESMRIVEFNEKPKVARPMPGQPDQALASMGIYVFSCELLIEALRADHADATSTHDFGHDILPKLIQSHDVAAYQFGTEVGRVTVDRYWRDVGTIDSYFEANMDLLKPVPPLDLYQRNWRIRTATTNSPPARTCSGPCDTEPRLINSIISPGAIVSGGIVINSVLSPDVTIHSGAQVVDSILFDRVTVGAGARVSRCIIEKDVVVPPGTIIDFDSLSDAPGCVISEKGVIVIPRGYSDWGRHSSQSSEVASDSSQFALQTT